MINCTIIMGRMCTSPELKHTPNNIPVTTFTLAHDKRKTAEGERRTLFVNCVAWRRQAEIAAKYLEKGMLVVVEGAVDIRKYTDRNGANKSITEVVVYDILKTSQKQKKF